MLENKSLLEENNQLRQGINDLNNIIRIRNKYINNMFDFDNKEREKNEIDKLKNDLKEKDREVNCMMEKLKNMELFHQRTLEENKKNIDEIVLQELNIEKEKLKNNILESLKPLLKSIGVKDDDCLCDILEQNCDCSELEDDEYCACGCED